MTMIHAEHRPADGRTQTPWGQHEVIRRGLRYAVKILTVMPGHRTSLQRHQHREEHWTVVRGTALVDRDGGRPIEFYEGESCTIPRGLRHRVANPGKIDLVIVETQLGSYLGDDDVERLEDDYGRVAPAPWGGAS